MLNLTKGQTQTIYFTGTEKATLTNPYFLFVFTHRLTGEVVKVMATNTSTTNRYNKFSLVINNSFNGVTNGIFSYSIYEKAVNTDLTLTGTIVESGYMQLNPAVDYTPTEYSGQTNTITTYNG